MEETYKVSYMQWLHFFLFLILAYKDLFDQLPNLKGTIDERRLALDRLLYESFRFKRFKLIEELTAYKNSLVEQKASSESGVNGLTSQSETKPEKTVKNPSKTGTNKTLDKKLKTDKKVKKVVNQSGKT